MACSSSMWVICLGSVGHQHRSLSLFYYRRSNKNGLSFLWTHEYKEMENYGSLLHNYLLKSREVSRLWSHDLNTSSFKCLLAPPVFSSFFLVTFFSAHWHCTPYWACLSLFWFLHPIAIPLSASSYLLCPCLPSPAAFFHSWRFVRGKNKWNLRRCWIQNCNTLLLTSVCIVWFFWGL